MKKITIVFLISILFSFTLKNQNKKSLVLEFVNTKNNKASIYLNLVSKAENFPSVHEHLYAVKPNSEGKYILKIDDLSYGKYAFSAFQDLNNDKEINKNFIGIPTEPYCFSNNVKPMFSMPKFNECAFDYNDNALYQKIEMVH